jgi:hypothetical protein
MLKDTLVVFNWLRVDVGTVGGGGGGAFEPTLKSLVFITAKKTQNTHINNQIT